MTSSGLTSLLSFLKRKACESFQLINWLQILGSQSPIKQPVIEFLIFFLVLSTYIQRHEIFQRHKKIKSFIFWIRLLFLFNWKMFFFSSTDHMTRLNFDKSVKTLKLSSPSLLSKPNSICFLVLILPNFGQSRIVFSFLIFNS